jgi:hypothetical protein
VVASLRDKSGRIEKGVLAQAKKASLKDLGGRDLELFESQCLKMSQATEAILGLEVPAQSGEPTLVREITVSRPTRMIFIESAGTRIPIDIGLPQTLGDYLVDRVLACFHGDWRPDFVHSLSDSGLSELKVMGETA